MSAFWQTVIPAVVTALAAATVAWTRTSRLRRIIDANLALLDRLPADRPAELGCATGQLGATSEGIGG
jgi:hypothetical protein